MAKKHKNKRAGVAQEFFSRNKIMLIVGLAVALTLTLVVLQERRSQSIEEEIYPIPTQTPTALQTSEKGDGWKEYISNEHGFSISLPEQFSIELVNETRSSVSPVVEQIIIKNENGTSSVRLDVRRYEDGEDFYDLIAERNNQHNYYVKPTEVYVNAAKGIYSIQSIGTKSDSVLYAFPHTSKTYIFLSYSALKSEIENASRSELIQEQIISSFNFI